MVLVSPQDSPFYQHYDLDLKDTPTGRREFLNLPEVCTQEKQPGIRSQNNQQKVLFPYAGPVVDSLRSLLKRKVTVCCKVFNHGFSRPAHQLIHYT